MINHSMSHQRGRTGTTLTEVLVSLMIMSIGVSFVAGIFPLSILKTVQSSQITNATMLRYKAESIMDMMDYRLHNPNGDETFAKNGLPANPQAYREHDGTNYIIDPWGYFIHEQDGSALDFNVEPEMLPPYGNATVTPYLLAGFPFGNHTTGFPGATSVLRFDGGVRADTFQAGPSAAWLKYQETLGAQLATSEDRWKVVVDTDTFEFVADADVRRRIRLSEANLSELGDPATRFATNVGNGELIPDREEIRVTVYRGDGRGSQSFPVTSITAAGDVYWSELIAGTWVDLNANSATDDRLLPLTFNDDAGVPDVGRVVVEVAQRRLFSWLMTVRKSSTDGSAAVDVAVVFNRAVDPKDEYAYPAVFIEGTDTVLVEYSGEPQEPFLKKGGYVFDAKNAEWYRIRDIEQQSLLSSWGFGDYDAVLRVDRRISKSAGEDILFPPDQAIGGASEDANGNNALDIGEDTNGNGRLDVGEDLNGDGVLQFGTAIFLPGVIEVYHLGVKQLPEDVL